MVAQAMAVQDQNGGSRSSSAAAAGNGVSMTVSSSELEDHFSSGNDYCPKVRKPYTISKQRERWTEEEHNKFLEALKLYGRAWRRIEEHVGTKTAVQIRSHAQKFFSKVVRESSGCNAGSSETIEIPPPRPKRKPAHPYPRKMVHPLNKEKSLWMLSLRSTSPNLSGSEQENQSPTSVLSAVGSASTDSNTPNRSLSPVSTDSAADHVDFSSDLNTSPKGKGLSSSVPTNDHSAAHDQLPKVQKLNLFPEVTDNSESTVDKDVPLKSLKLFGKIVHITECLKLSSPATDMEEEKSVRQLPAKNMEYTWSQLPYGTIPKVTSNDSTIHIPWWSMYGFVPFQMQESTRVHLDAKGEEVHDKEIQKEGSWTGSNSGSMNGEDNLDRSMDYDDQSLQPCCAGDEKSTSGKLRVIHEKNQRGFVPYKKRKKETATPRPATEDEKDEQRIRTSL